MKDYRVTIRLTAEDMARMRNAMKLHKLQKRSQIVRVALKALEKDDNKEDSGEILVKLPKNLIKFLKLKKKTGYASYSHIITELVRNHFVAQLDDVKAIAAKFKEAENSMVSIEEEDEEIIE